MVLTLDHIAVAGETLAEAVAHVEDALGVVMAPGGVHVEMGTHNRLLALGPGLYLEAIAVNPEAAHPARPRWFDLDRFLGPARLSNWIARTDDLAAALGAAPEGTGVPVSFTRGKYHWQMAVPGSGRLPWDGAAPALIQWDGALHPADQLPDAGLRLERLFVGHPEAGALLAAFPALANMAGVEVTHAPRVRLRAEIRTPDGPRMLE
jgi:hypothetical protein